MIISPQNLRFFLLAIGLIPTLSSSFTQTTDENKLTWVKFNSRMQSLTVELNNFSKAMEDTSLKSKNLAKNQNPKINNKVNLEDRSVSNVFNHIENHFYKKSGHVAKHNFKKKLKNKKTHNDEIYKDYASLFKNYKSLTKNSSNVLNDQQIHHYGFKINLNVVPLQAEEVLKCLDSDLKSSMSEIALIKIKEKETISLKTLDIHPISTSVAIHIQAPSYQQSVSTDTHEDFQAQSKFIENYSEKLDKLHVVQSQHTLPIGQEELLPGSISSNENQSSSEDLLFYDYSAGKRVTNITDNKFERQKSLDLNGQKLSIRNEREAHGFSTESTGRLATLDSQSIDGDYLLGHKGEYSLTKKENRYSAQVQKETNTQSGDLSQFAKNEEQNIPVSVQQAIKRAMARAGDQNIEGKFLTNVTKVSNYQSPMNALIADFSTRNKIQEREEKKSNANHKNNMQLQNIPKLNSKVSIHVFAPVLGNELGPQLTNFDIRPHFNFNKVITDQQDGEAILENRLNESKSVFSAAILKQGYMITNVDFVLGKEEIGYQIPLFGQTAFIDFMQRHHFKKDGGYIFIHANEEIESIKVDHSYEGILYLDEQMKVVKKGAPYSFVLIVGVDPGNTLLTYQLTGEVQTSKILYVAENEVYFESAIFERSKTEYIELYEDKLLSKIRPELNIEPNEIHSFYQNKRPKERGLNRFEIVHSVMPLGTREIFEFNHLGSPIYVGRQDKEELIIPDLKMVNHIFDIFSVEDLQGQCLIQVNLTQAPKSMQIDGRSPSGLSFKILYLDKNGDFSPTISRLTEKAFFKGDAQGTLDGKITYLDGSADLFQTYCTNDTFLIEQF